MKRRKTQRNLRDILIESYKRVSANVCMCVRERERERERKKEREKDR